LSVKPSDDFTKKQCSTFQDEIAIQIPQLNFPLVTVGKFAKDSKRFQASMLKITKKLVDSFRVANASAERIDSLSTQVDDQLTHVYRSLDVYSNSNHLFEFVEQPLRNVTEFTKRIAHHYLSTARKFEQLFHLMKVVVNGSLGKKLMNLEKAINVVEGHLHSSAHSQRQLEKAIQSVTNSSIETALRLERDNAELELVAHHLHVDVRLLRATFRPRVGQFQCQAGTRQMEK
jgi:CII-binding regulator of phage lambda lysogenization HflD